MFDNIYRYDEFKLREDQQWLEQHQQFADNNIRGYGYWLWKPYLIYKYIKQLDPGDVLVYADSGCEIIPDTYDYLSHLLNTTGFDVSISRPSTDGLCDPNQDYSNKRYCKKAVLEYFNVLTNDILLNAEQYQASCQVIYVSNKMKRFVKKWLDTCSIYRLLDDTKYENELKSFVDHRHDQAIYSILLSIGDYCIDTTVPHAIKICRNRSGISQFNFPNCDYINK